MSKLLVLVCLSLTVSTVFAALARLPKQTPPEKYNGLDGCYFPEFDLMMPKGIECTPPGQCRSIICGSDGEIQIATCGVVGVPDGFKAVFDKSLPYPECCNPVKQVPIDSSEAKC